MPEILNYKDIISKIRGDRIKGLYLFYGSEGLLIREAVAAMRKKLLNPSFESLNFIRFEGQSAAAAAVINACETLPFFDDRKIVLVSDCDLFKGKKGAIDNAIPGEDAEALIKYMSNIPETTVLIFTSGDNIDKRKKIYAAVKKNGEVAEFSRLKGQELLSWIAMSFKRCGKKISKADAMYLGENVSGDLENFSREIDKVCSYAGTRVDITRRDIDSVISKSLESNIFKLVDFISSKKAGRALSVLNDLILESEPVPVILTMIIRQYRLLLNTKLLQDKGCSDDDLCRKLGIMPFIAANLSKTARNYNLQQIEDRLGRCLDADISIKKGKMDQRTALETLIVEFSE